uniref:FMRFamide-like neuropeptide FLP2 n=1 Tax=Penaeus monodon TaxID=6687 RepID=FAR2_PENMO|nr:RecName: Full=FMRFamide-like neuropeptide FLP2; AltName: Full=AYSNLNYLRF-amide [Penaeus monodon]
AYSNLNYLRF